MVIDSSDIFNLLTPRMPFNLALESANSLGPGPAEDFEQHNTQEERILSHTENNIPEALLKLGMKTRREVLGDEYVDAATAAATDFDSDFQQFISATAWGSVWSRPGLSRRDRSLITITLLASLGHHSELALHLRASVNTGLSPEDVKEALLHVAIYAGVPAANTAYKIAKEIFAKPSPTPQS